MKIHHLFVASLTCATLLSACRKDIAKTADRAVVAGQIIPSNPTLSGVLGVGWNTVDTIHLTSNIAWHLNGLVYVNAPDVLIIDPGTVIRGDLSANGAAPGGGLVVARGAKILAEGTAANPIVFTSAQANPASGDWAGVVIIGNAPTNDPGRRRVEGLSDVALVDVSYGTTNGTVANDNSGVLKYVRFEYGGYEYSSDNEINGLTLAGVGAGTIIDYIEIYKAKDDGIEFFGGTVNVSHLVVVDPLDDMFDFDNGYTGKINYALGVADSTRADKTGSNGIESDNNSMGANWTPLTKPVIDHMTLIGVSSQARASITNGQPSSSGTYGRGAHLRRGTRFDIQNSIFMGYNRGISLDGGLGDTPCSYANGGSILYNNLIHAYVTPLGKEANSSCVINEGENSVYISALPNVNISLVRPFTRPVTASAANYFPAAVSDARDFACGAFTFSGTDWAAGWTRF